MGSVLVLAGCGVSDLLDDEVERCSDGIGVADSIAVHCDDPIQYGGDWINSPDLVTRPQIDATIRCYVLRYRERYEAKCGMPMSDTGLWDDPANLGGILYRDGTDESPVPASPLDTGP